MSVAGSVSKARVAGCTSDPVCMYLSVLKKEGDISVGLGKKYLHDTDKQYLSLFVGIVTIL